MDLYRDNILDHYQNPRNFGHLKAAVAKAEENNPLCGDRIGMEVKFKVQSATRWTKFKVIEEVKFYGEGCSISMASASMLTEKIKGKSIDAVKKLATDDILEMLGIQLTPTRLKCALLALEVLQKALVKL